MQLCVPCVPLFVCQLLLCDDQGTVTRLGHLSLSTHTTPTRQRSLTEPKQAARARVQLRVHVHTRSKVTRGQVSWKPAKGNGALTSSVRASAHRESGQRAAQVSAVNSPSVF